MLIGNAICLEFERSILQNHHAGISLYHHLAEIYRLPQVKIMGMKNVAGSVHKLS